MGQPSPVWRRALRHGTSDHREVGRPGGPPESRLPRLERDAGPEHRVVVVVHTRLGMSDNPVPSVIAVTLTPPAWVQVRAFVVGWVSE